MRTTLFLVTILLIATSCCRNDQRKKYELTPAQRALIPYQDGQRIRFTNNYKEEIMAEISRSTVTKNYDIDHCAECCTVKETLELDITEIKQTGGTIAIPYFVNVPENSVLQDARRYLHIVFENDIETIIGTSAPSLYGSVVEYDNRGNFVCNTTNNSECLDEIVVLGETYKNVLKITWPGFKQERPDKRYEEITYYYQQEKGLLRITQKIYDDYFDTAEKELIDYSLAP